MHKPTEEEYEECLKGKTCEYGICDECTMCVMREDGDNEEQE